MNEPYLEHPEIEWVNRTGYPSWNQPQYYECERCHEELSFEDIFEDEDYEMLCKDCLCELHQKAW